VEFITGSISAVGFFEAAPFIIKKDDPLRALFLIDTPEGLAPALNYTLLHGVRAALTLRDTGDVDKARAQRNPDLAPHLSFADLGGHGYSMVTATPQWLETEFVCIPRPLERSDSPDGGPLRYRVTHRAELWQSGQRPSLVQKVIEGSAKYSI
jgi:alkaline phosphatase D